MAERTARGVVFEKYTWGDHQEAIKKFLRQLTLRITGSCPRCRQEQSVRLIDAKVRVLAAEAHLTKMATNCVPTIQDATLATNTKREKQTELLENIDKNIAILVDRGRCRRFICSRLGVSKW